MKKSLLTSPSPKPALKPPPKPAAQPASQPATKPAKPAAKPTAKPAVKSSTAVKSGVSSQKKCTSIKTSNKVADSSLDTMYSSSSAVSVQVNSVPLEAHVLLRYNHYREDFCIIDGQLSVSDIDERFCLSFAFPKCKLHMTDIEGSTSPNVDENPVDGLFFNLQGGKTYWVLVEEDLEEAKLSEERNRAYLDRKAKATFNQEASCGQKKRGVDLLTEELKNLSAEELREAGPRYQELLAARDLEDCVFS